MQKAMLRRTHPLSAMTAVAVGLLSTLALAGPAAPAVRAGTSALAGPVLTVARGTTSAQTSGWEFSEIVPGEFPTAGFSMVIEIRPSSGSPDGISFDPLSIPVFQGPSSLKGKVTLVGARSLRVDIGSSNASQVETFDVLGLRLTASETCGLGPVLASYVTSGFSGSFGYLPPIASAGGVAPTPTPTPTPTPAPVPTPTAAPPILLQTVVAARVAAGTPAALTTGFRSVVTAAPAAPITVRATLRPIDAGRSVSLYRRSGDAGTWRFVVSVRTDTAGIAVVATRASLPRGWSGAREVQFRWQAPAIGGRSAAVSDVARVIVR